MTVRVVREAACFTKNGHLTPYGLNQTWSYAPNNLCHSPCNNCVTAGISLATHVLNSILELRPVEKTPAQSKPQRILVVDDEPDVVELLSYHLKNAGYRVRTVTDATTSIERARSFLPHLVNLELTMPELNGTQICRILRSDPEMKNVPIIFLTARGEEVDRVRGFEAGCDDYVIAAAVTPDGKSVYVASHLPQDRADSSDVAATVTVIDAASRRDDDDPPAQRQLERAGPVHFARREICFRGACPGPLSVAGYATGPRLDEHQRHERHRRPGPKLVSTVLLDDVDLRRGQSLGRDRDRRRQDDPGEPLRHARDERDRCERAVRQVGQGSPRRRPPADVANDLSFPGRLAAADRAGRQRPARLGRGRLEGLCGRILQRHAWAWSTWRPKARAA